MGKQEVKDTNNKENPLGYESVTKLMLRFAIPSIIAMIVGAIYNLVDQLFIGQAVGTLGNAATNIAFPFSTACLSLSLLFGIGGASCFNLTLGRGDKEKAPYFVGNAICMLVACGTIICLISQIFMRPLLLLFGSPEEVLPYATEYVRITAIGFPFLMLVIGGGHLIRADGSPKMTMICSIIGAVINTVLDALFVLVFRWGMMGAALATIIGQIISAIVVIRYLMHYKTVPLKKEHFKLDSEYLGMIMAIGMASFFNQVAMLIVQVIMNHLFKHYGALSVYGEAIPIACVGIVMKVSQLFFSIVIGLGQGTQPIESFNYGAKKYDRVKKAYKAAMIAGATISIFAFGLFQIFPRQILSMFGEGTPEYYEFGVKCFRWFQFFIWLNFVQPITSTFFTSIGKAIKGVILSLTRQILFLIPLAFILPLFLGIDGVLLAGPSADLLACIMTLSFAAVEIRGMNKEMQEERHLNR